MTTEIDEGDVYRQRSMVVKGLMATLFESQLCLLTSLGLSLLIYKMGLIIVSVSWGCSQPQGEDSIRDYSLVTVFGIWSVLYNKFFRGPVGDKKLRPFSESLVRGA